jgi:hypothetical protein
MVRETPGYEEAEKLADEGMANKNVGEGLGYSANQLTNC